MLIMNTEKGHHLINYLISSGREQCAILTQCFLDLAKGLELKLTNASGIISVLEHISCFFPAASSPGPTLFNTTSQQVVGRTRNHIYHLAANCVQTRSQCFSLESPNKLSTFLRSRENSTPKFPTLDHTTLRLGFFPFKVRPSYIFITPSEL